MRKKPTYLTGDDAIWVATFQNNLKYIMYNKNVSTPALGRKLGMTPYETKKNIFGNNKPTDDLIRKITDILECTVDDLLDEDGNPWNFGKSEEEIAELNAIRKREREEIT